MKIERNSPCTCGSGKKYKKCCLSLETQPIQIVEIDDFKLHKLCDNALAQIEAGDLQSAEIEAERLYHLHPEDHMVNYLQGVCCIQREHYKQAIPYFEKAVKVDSGFCEAHFNLATLYCQEIKVPQAVACLTKIIEIQGEHGDLGKLAKGKLDRLKDSIYQTSGQTLESYLQSMSLFDEAFAFLRRKEHQMAISYFQQVLALDPNHVQSYGNMALAYSALGQQELALQYLDQALLLNPNYEPAQQNREVIKLLKEGEVLSFEMREVYYYPEKFDSEGKRKKPQSMSWSDSDNAYVPLEIEV